MSGQLELIEGAIEDGDSPVAFDLITCIHGLHYIGDKLGVLQKIGMLLKPDGRFMGNLSLENIRDEQGRPLDRWLRAQWRLVGWDYHAKRRLLTMSGQREWPLRWAYLGADDQAGPNYTGQEAVHSYYRIG